MCGKCLLGAVGGQESDEVLTVGLLLQTGEHHLGAGDHLLGVRYPLVNGVGIPYDAGICSLEFYMKS